MKYIGQAVEQFQKMDARVSNIEYAVVEMAKHIDSRDKSLAPLVELAEKAKKMREAQSTNTQQSSQQGTAQSLGGLLQLLPMIMGSGGGESEFDKTLKEMGMENMLLGREVIRQVFSRGAKEILDTVDGKMKAFRESRSQK